MGQMTLDDFRTELRDASGRPSVSNARLDRWIMQAMYEFGYAFKFHCLEGTGTQETVVGVDTYDLPNDLRVINENGVEIIAPSDCLGRLLSETRVQWRLHRDTSSDTTNYCTPTHYHNYNGKLIIRPKPDDTYTLDFDYWKRITQLAEPDAVSPFEDDWDDVIFTGALYRVYRAFGEFERYKNVRNDFLALVRSRVLEEDLEEFPVGGLGPQRSKYDDVIR